MPDATSTPTAGTSRSGAGDVRRRRGRRRGRRAPRGRPPRRAAVSIARSRCRPGCGPPAVSRRIRVGAGREEARGPRSTTPRPRLVAGSSGDRGAPSRPGGRPRRHRRRLVAGELDRVGSTARTISAIRSRPASAVIATTSGGRRPRAIGATRASATASSSASSRGVPGTRLSPIASAPARTAARMPSASVMPQIFTNGRVPPRFAGSVGARPAATNGRGRGAPDRRSGRAPRRRARASKPSARQAGDGRGVADAGLGDRRGGRPGRAPRSRIARSVSTSSVRRSRLLIPISRAFVASGPLQLPLVVGLDERLQPDLEGPIDEPGERACAGWRTASSRTRSAPAARRCGSWIASTTNSLARTGMLTAARTARRSSTEPPNQCGSQRTRDRGRAAGLVGAGAGDDVVVGRPRSRPADGERALDLGDQVQARARRAGRGCRAAAGVALGGGEVVVEAERVAISSRMSARRRSAISATTLRLARRGPADGASSSGGGRRSTSGRSSRVMPALPRRPAAERPRRRAPLRPQPLEQLRRRGRRRSSAPPGRSPRARSSTTPATTSAAPAFSSTTSRRAPGSPRRTASTIRAFSSGVPPASFAVGAFVRPSAAASTVRTLDALRRHVVEDAAAVERQLVDALAVDDERPLRAEAAQRRPRSFAAHRRVGDADDLAARPGRVRQRADEVERGPDADLAAGRARRASSPGGSRARTGTRSRCRAERRGGRLGVVVDADAERVEDVGRAGLATSSRGCRASRPGRRPPRRRGPPSSRC